VARVDLVRTSGVFTLGDDRFDVENNVWLVGDDTEVLVIDAAHDHAPIVDGIGDRRVVAIACTHGHNDHVNAAAALADATGAPVLLHADDDELWQQVYPDRKPDGPLHDGDALRAGGACLTVLHTPGHTPGGVCLYDAVHHMVFAGDTLFRGGPGATGRPFSDFATIIDSIQRRLLGLPPETAIHPGHGDSTTVGDEARHLPEWLERGY
jgi:glyoxylase-like metal-dependent hydrolase (beta-lactamase superfamily II)